MTEKLLSVTEVADRLQISRRRVLAILNDGLGRFDGAYKVGNFWVIPEDVVIKFEKQRETEEVEGRE
ncbi:helix-turn-helix domain-containing protein [Aminobacterium colombiense]